MPFARDGLVGSIRLTLGADGGLTPGLIDKYSLGPFLDEIPPDEIIVGERFMVDKALRGTDVLFQMFSTYMRLVNELRIQLMIGDCEPHLLNVYQALGFRPYAQRNINSTDAGYLIPLVVVAEDIDYVRRLGSPLADVMADFGDEHRIPACVEWLVEASAGCHQRTPRRYRQLLAAGVQLARRARVASDLAVRRSRRRAGTAMSAQEHDPRVPGR